DFCLIFAPLNGYDEPEILLSQLNRFCLIAADAAQANDKKPADVWRRCRDGPRLLRRLRGPTMTSGEDILVTGTNR
ncbi:hypothetical protein, partial [Mesorhizobium sp. M0478]|uniref:hypothetical protein n=1 Tax=Mesorhizobium sp. M0478 TaxID=2956947 RepID=UPI0033373F52